jgi:hypothetical protein
MFFRKAIRVSKNAAFNADFESVEKVTKTSCEICSQRDRTMEFFIFMTVCKGFLPINFFEVNFSHFIQRIQTQCWILGLWYPYRIVILFCLFKHFLPKSDETSQKNEKRFINVSYNPIYSKSVSGRLHFVKKSQNRCSLVYNECILKFVSYLDPAPISERIKRSSNESQQLQYKRQNFTT